jgi:WD40 repeat protein
MAFARSYAADHDDLLVVTTGERPMILPVDGSPPLPIASRTTGLPELAVSPDGHRIALGDDASGVVQLWTTLAQWLGEAHDLRGGISELRFSPDGSLLLGGGQDKRAAVWETPSLTLRGMVVASRGEATAGDYYPHITALAWSADDRRFATVGWNERRAQLWRTPAGNRIAQLPSHGSALAGDKLVTQSEGKLTIRDVVTGAVRAEWVSQPNVDINDNTWLTTDGRHAVVARDSTTSLFDLTSGPDKLAELTRPLDFPAP